MRSVGRLKLGDPLTATGSVAALRPVAWSGPIGSLAMTSSDPSPARFSLIAVAFSAKVLMQEPFESHRQAQ